jgi:hypothetical protein
MTDKFRKYRIECKHENGVLGWFDASQTFSSKNYDMALRHLSTLNKQDNKNGVFYRLVEYSDQRF